MKPVCQIYDLLDDIDSEELFDDVLRLLKIENQVIQRLPLGFREL